MKHILLFAALLSTAAAMADDAGRLYIIGEATPGGWSLDDAQALLPSPDNAALRTGTIYLKAGDAETFKFMTSHEWGSLEYGLPADAASDLVEGSFALASGTSDEGYRQMQVAQAGNYCITVDTEALTASVVLSAYQATEITECSLFLVGSATEGGWAVEDGTPLYQSQTEPYEFSANVTLKADGSFKIARTVRGGGTFDSKYYYFRNGDDDSRISTDGTDDRQWTVTEDGSYTVRVNTLGNTVTVEKNNGASTIAVAATVADGSAETVYYNLQGHRVANPADGGLYIRLSAGKASKVVF